MENQRNLPEGLRQDIASATRRAAEEARALTPKNENKNPTLPDTLTITLRALPPINPDTGFREGSIEDHRAFVDKFFRQQQIRMGIDPDWSVKQSIKHGKRVRRGLAIYRMLSRIGKVRCMQVYLISAHIGLVSAVLFPTGSQEIYRNRNFVFSSYYSLSWPTTIHTFILEAMGLCLVIFSIRLLARHPRVFVAILNLLSRIFSDKRKGGLTKQ
jgi:hypothetical protein